MNVFEYNRAVRDASIPVAVKALLWTLATYYTPDRMIRPALETLAKACGVSPRHMRKTIAKAESLGWIKRVLRSGQTTRYILQTPQKTPVSNDRGGGASATGVGGACMPGGSGHQRPGGPVIESTLPRSSATPKETREETREETTPPAHTQAPAREASPPTEPEETPHTLSELHEVWAELFDPDPIPHHLRKSRGKTYAQLSSALYALADAGDRVKSPSAFFRKLVTETYADPTEATDVKPEAIREAYKRARGIVQRPVYLVAEPDPVPTEREVEARRALLRKAKRELFGIVDGGEGSNAA